MEKERRSIPATELRVHLGETLRQLDDVDIVIEKGGVPVAILSRFKRAPSSMSSFEAEYERAVSKRGERAGWARMDAAMESGWVGVEAEELVAEIYRARRAGASSRVYSLDEDDEAVTEGYDGEDPAGQRHMYPLPSPPTKRIADGDRPEYTP